MYSALRPHPFGPLENELFRIDVPPTALRSHHPQDSQAVPVIETAWSASSAQEHMHIGKVEWRDEGKPGARSTQVGSHFDKSFHFRANNLGAGIKRRHLQGPARILDIRTELAEMSDYRKITAQVVRAAIKRTLETCGEREVDTWERILLRSLSDSDAQSKMPLEAFPYFENAAAVQVLARSVREHTSINVRALFHEPPSVEKVDGGYLDEASEGKGGAHGAFARNGIAIGENWDFNPTTTQSKERSRLFQDGTIGEVQVYFDQTMGTSRDSLNVAGAYFIPYDSAGNSAA